MLESPNLYKQNPTNAWNANQRNCPPYPVGMALETLSPTTVLEVKRLHAWWKWISDTVIEMIPKVVLRPKLQGWLPTGWMEPAPNRRCFWWPSPRLSRWLRNLMVDQRSIITFPLKLLFLASIIFWQTNIVQRRKRVQQFDNLDGKPIRKVCSMLATKAKGLLESQTW